MEKTDSVLNLTKPSLFGIYNSSTSDLNQENDQVEEYLDGSELHINVKDANFARSRSGLRESYTASQIGDAEKSAPGTSFFGIIGRTTLMALAALAYNEVTRNIHSTHADGRGADINAYLLRFLYLLQPSQALVDKYNLDISEAKYVAYADYAFAMILEGVALSIVVPLLDNIMPLSCTRRLLSSNPTPTKRGNLATDIVRSLIAFLGISYAIRNVAWKSSLQMALTWSLINPGLWLLLDGTINGFVASVLVAGGGSAIIYAQNFALATMDTENLVTVFLFIGSFFFCGVIIFGKLGRYLFA
ncbi:hypothetical protein PUMCH_001564 [Australozyma saopauloensis]|uniref:Uncharacterized protein n=1 Tax=Australozyma saopauloensis TaxID=291208 RepID=A0AAX4H6U4_9ASCO|nr:hypothetical protein PUMCH_001564 [[Candida] saopauloensis]